MVERLLQKQLEWRSSKRIHFLSNGGDIETLFVVISSLQNKSIYILVGEIQQVDAES